MDREIPKPVWLLGGGIFAACLFVIANYIHSPKVITISTRYGVIDKAYFEGFNLTLIKDSVSKDRYLVNSSGGILKVGR